MNIRAVRQRLPDGELLSRYKKIAQLLTGKDDAELEDAVSWVNDLCQELAIQPLRAYGLAQEQLPLLVEEASRAAA